MKETYVIEMDIDKVHRNIPTAFINFRMNDYNGHFIGITGIGIALSTLQLLIEHYEAKFKRRVYFVGQDGDIVLAGKGMKEITGSILALPGLSRIARQILNESKLPLQLEYQGQDYPVLANSRYIPELKWYLIVEQNEAASVQPLQTALGINLLISVVVTVLVLAITLYTVNHIQLRLEHLASIDKLSGLANREQGDILLDQAMQDATRFGQRLCLVLVDIDHFKQINDHYGHLSGDGVIQELSALLRASVRRTDVVSRWGGEEFIILMNGCSLKEAAALAEKIRAKTAAHHFALNPPASITASFGVVECQLDETSSGFFARADAALYAAKANGRNQVSLLGSPPMNTRS
jgi:diguanylate cyclase (GGDEF)-like protein